MGERMDYMDHGHTSFHFVVGIKSELYKEQRGLK